MKKLAIILLAALGFINSSANACSPAWTSGSFEDALAKAKATNKLLLLDFFQEYG